MAKQKRAINPEGPILLGFDTETLQLRLEQIVRIKILNEGTKNNRRYKQIMASIREVGIIEPPVVVPDPQTKDRYILLDGHLRIEALKEIGVTEVTCLVSTDDESFTYNKHVNRLSTIQEHRMIVKAVERGVSEEKIAQALDVNISNIIRKRSLLDGICEEAAEILKDKLVTARVFYILKRMIPVRQIEATTLMADADIYTAAYAKALLAATPKNQLANPQKPKKIKGLTDEQMDRMESEMSTLQREYRLIEESYGTDVLHLTLAKGYLAGLLGNAKVVKYLALNQPEILAQFQKIAEMTSLGGKEAA